MTRSTNYADEFGIDPASPTRRLLRRSHSTTMDKLKRKINMSRNRTTLDDLELSPSFLDDTRVDNATNRKASAALDTDGSISGNSGESILSRDGDTVIYHNISMSTPKFAKSLGMPPPESFRQPQSSLRMTDTQSMSEWSENPLEILLRQQAPDDLPSTKPSSQADGTYPPASFGTQDQIEIAFQLGEEILGEPNLENTGAESNGRLQAPDESADELELPGKTHSKRRNSKKRVRDPEDEELVSRKSSKIKPQEEAEEDELFSGLPAEQYHPRKSRLRGSEIDIDLFANVDFSKRPEDEYKKKKKKLSRGKTLDDSVFVPVRKEDSLNPVDEGDIIPIKSRSQRTKAIKAEFSATEPSKKSESSGDKICSTGTGEAIIVAVEHSAKDDANILHQDDLDLDVRIAKSKSRTDSKKGKKKHVRSRALQEIDAVLHGEVPSAEESSVNHKASGEETVQHKDDVEPRCADTASSQQTGKTSISTTSKKTKSSKKKCIEAEEEDGSDEKSTSENMHEMSEKDTDSPSLRTQSPGPAALAEKDEKQASGLQPLKDITNTSISSKQPALELATDPDKSASIKPNRALYRIGLSRSSRIEPLLKIVRKERDGPRAPAKTSKKKGPSSVPTHEE